MANSIPAHMINEVMSCSSNVIEPKVGMLGTYFVGSDRYAIAVAKVITNKKIFVIDVNSEALENKTIDNNGIEWISDEYITEYLNKYTPNEEVCKRMYGDDYKPEYLENELEYFYNSETYSLRKNGRWVHIGEGLWACGSIHLGVADPYIDPSF